MNVHQAKSVSGGQHLVANLALHRELAVSGPLPDFDGRHKSVLGGMARVLEGGVAEQCALRLRWLGHANGPDQRERDGGSDQWSLDIFEKD